MPQQKVLRKILEKVFITKKFTQCKTSCMLITDVFEIPSNRHIGKLFSKYELLFLDRANSSSDPSQILILQFPIPRDFLPPLLFLLNFALAKRNSSSTQSSSCSSSVPLFCPNPFDHMSAQALDILKHMVSYANHIHYQAISKS